MRAKITYVVTAAVLVFYFVLVGSRGVLLIEHGTLITVTFGVAVLILPVIGIWFLWMNTQFVSQGQRAGRGTRRRGRPAGRRAGPHPGRPHRPRLGRRGLRPPPEETEDAPDDWRCWFRLAVAYHDASDTPRARKAMQRAIALHEDRTARPSTS